MNRTVLNSTSRHSPDIESMYSQVTHPQSAHGSHESSSNVNNSRDIEIEYHDDYRFTVYERSTTRSLYIHIIPCGKKCYIRFNDLAIKPLLLLSNLENIEQDGDSVIIEPENGKKIDIRNCSLNMFCLALEHLGFYIDKHLEAMHSEIQNVYDGYGQTQSHQQKYAEWVHHYRLYMFHAQQRQRMTRPDQTEFRQQPPPILQLAESGITPRPHLQKKKKTLFGK